MVECNPIRFLFSLLHLLMIYFVQGRCRHLQSRRCTPRANLKFDGMTVMGQMRIEGSVQVAF